MRMVFAARFFVDFGFQVRLRGVVRFG